LEYLVDLSVSPVEVTTRLYDPSPDTHFFAVTVKDRSSFHSFGNIEARFPSGTAKDVSIGESGRIEIPAGRHRWIELHYEVDISNGPKLKRLMGYELFLIPGKPLFEHLESAQVVVQTRRDSQLETPWVEAFTQKPPGRKEIAGFTLEHPTRLPRYALAFGEFEKSRSAKSGVYRFAISRKIPTSIAKTVKEHVSVFGQHLRNRLGDVEPVLVSVNQKQREGAKLTGTSSPNGIALNISLDKTPSDFALNRTIAHELIHLWNGERIRYAGEQLAWLKEGYTEWLALKVLFRTRVGELSPIRQYVRDFLGNKTVDLEAYRKGIAYGLYMDSGAVAAGKCPFSFRWLNSLRKKPQPLTAESAARSMSEVRPTPESEFPNMVFKEAGPGVQPTLSESRKRLGLPESGPTDIEANLEGMPFDKFLGKCSESR
jgi:hypothetical protein